MSIYKGTQQIAGIPTGLVDTINSKADADNVYTKSENDNLLTNKTNINASNLSTTGKSYLSGLGMPSSRYVDLTLGASGATYTAPANGYVCLRVNVGAGTSYMTILQNGWSNQRVYQLNYLNVSMFCPVAKGNFRVDHANITSVLLFRFIYAEGDE